MTRIKVVIPLAGKGSRMRPLTLTKAKPLLPVAGRPVLDHVLDRFSRLDIEEYLLVTGYLKEQIEHYFKSHELPSKFFEQKVQDGPASAIRLVKDSVHGPILICYVDTIFDADLGAINGCEDDGIIWVQEVEDYQRFGVVVAKDGIMTDIVEKPSEPISNLANIGVYYIKNHRLFFEGIEYMYKNKLTVKGEYFLPEAFRYMISKGARIRVLPVDAWLDCGEPATTLESNAILLKGSNAIHGELRNCKVTEPVYIGEGSIVESCIIGPNVSVGAHCKLSGCTVENSIIDSGCHLTNAKLKDSFVGENVHLDCKREAKQVMLGDYSKIKDLP